MGELAVLLVKGAGYRVDPKLHIAYRGITRVRTSIGMSTKAIEVHSDRKVAHKWCMTISQVRNRKPFSYSPQALNKVYKRRGLRRKSFCELSHLRRWSLIGGYQKRRPKLYLSL